LSVPVLGRLLLAPAIAAPRHMRPTTRANPFPKVTDLFCRLPLSTFFYRLEAPHLGDLMRFAVRPGGKVNVTGSAFHGSSRALRTPPRARGALPALPLRPPRWISHFRGPRGQGQQEKRTLAGTLADVAEVGRVAAQCPPPGAGMSACSPFDRVGTRKMSPSGQELPRLSGPTHPCPITVRTEPFSTSVFKDLA